MRPGSGRDRQGDAFVSGAEAAAVEKLWRMSQTDF